MNPADDARERRQHLRDQRSRQRAMAHLGLELASTRCVCRWCMEAAAELRRRGRGQP